MTQMSVRSNNGVYIFFYYKKDFKKNIKSATGKKYKDIMTLGWSR